MGAHCLRLLEQTAADELYDVISANRALLSRRMPRAVGQTRKETAAFIRSSREQWARNDGFQAEIVDRDAIVGAIGFSRMDWANRSASLGYWLAEAAQGRGIVTKVTRALVTHGFDRGGFLGRPQLPGVDPVPCIA